MHLSICILFWCFIGKVKARLEITNGRISSNFTYPALTYNLQFEKLDDMMYHSNDTRRYYYFTACPAFTPKQIQISNDISLTGESIFLRSVHDALSIEKNTCEKPLKPVLIYHSKRKVYLMGYELYYEDGAMKLESEDYENLRQVNMENNTICPKKRFNSSTIIKYQDKNNTKFYFTDGSPTLIFHWIPVLEIQQWPPYGKQMNFGKVQRVNKDKNPTDNFKDYNLEDDLDSFYSEKNQAASLKNILPSSSSGNNSESCGQIYGCLEKSQIIPSWFYKSNPEKLASFSNMNSIPVWKSISKQLEKVDRSIYEFAQFYRKSPIPGIIDDVNLIFGISGVVKMNSTINPNQSQEIHLSNPKNNQTIPIPNIIYRIIGYKVTKQYYSRQVILIHNNPAAVFDRDGLCTEKEELVLHGYSISNKDSRTGLSYVCPGTKKLYKELGIEIAEECDDLVAMHVQSITHAPHLFW